MCGQVAVWKKDIDAKCGQIPSLLLGNKVKTFDHLILTQTGSFFTNISKSSFSLKYQKILGQDHKFTFNSWWIFSRWLYIFVANPYPSHHTLEKQKWLWSLISCHRNIFQKMYANLGHRFCAENQIDQYSYNHQPSALVSISTTLLLVLLNTVMKSLLVVTKTNLGGKVTLSNMQSVCVFQISQCYALFLLSK